MCCCIFVLLSPQIRLSTDTPSGSSQQLWPVSGEWNVTGNQIGKHTAYCSLPHRISLIIEKPAQWEYDKKAWWRPTLRQRNDYNLTCRAQTRSYRRHAALSAKGQCVSRSVMMSNWKGCISSRDLYYSFCVDVTLFTAVILSSLDNLNC